MSNLFFIQSWGVKNHKYAFKHKNNELVRHYVEKRLSEGKEQVHEINSRTEFDILVNSIFTEWA